MRRHRFGFFFLLALSTVALHQHSALAIVAASDNSGNATYNSGWSTGTNGGSGYGAWTLQSTSGSGGFFQASATNNDNGGSSSANINAGGDSFGMFANSSARAAGYRPFNLTTSETALQPGYVFSWKMDNGGVDDPGSSVGLSLRNGNANGDATDGTLFSGRRFGFEFQQGNANYKIVDSTGIRDTGINFTRTGLLMNLSLTSLDSYALHVYDVNSGGLAGSFTGTFAGTLGSAINSFAIYDRFAGSGGNRDAFFNTFTVTAIPEASPLLSIPFALVSIMAGVIGLRRLRLA